MSCNFTVFFIKILWANQQKDEWSFWDLGNILTTQRRHAKKSQTFLKTGDSADDKWMMMMITVPQRKLKPGAWQKSGCWKLTCHWSGDKVSGPVLQDKSLAHSWASIAYQKELPVRSLRMQLKTKTHSSAVCFYTAALFYSHSSSACLKRKSREKRNTRQERGAWFVYISGSPDSHLSCCHQQHAVRTEEKQTQPIETGTVSHHEACVGNLWVHLTKQSITHLRNNHVLMRGNTKESTQWNRSASCFCVYKRGDYKHVNKGRGLVWCHICTRRHRMRKITERSLSDKAGPAVDVTETSSTALTFFSWSLNGRGRKELHCGPTAFRACTHFEIVYARF